MTGLSREIFSKTDHAEYYFTAVEAAVNWVYDRYMKLTDDQKKQIAVDTVNKIIDSSNINEFEDVDIIMEAFDNPRYKAEIASFILKNMKDKYLISSSGMAGFYDSNIIKTKMIKERFFICGDGVNEAKEGDGLMAPRVSICANHMANLATKILIEYIK